MNKAKIEEYKEDMQAAEERAVAYDELGWHKSAVMARTIASDLSKLITALEGPGLRLVGGSTNE